MRVHLPLLVQTHQIERHPRDLLSGINPLDSRFRGNDSVTLFNTFVLVAAFLALTCTASAADEPVVVKGEQVEYFDAAGKAVASGGVVATYKDMKLSCDNATIYMQTKDAYLKGRVCLWQPDGLLKGEEVLYNFETRKGVVLPAEGESGPWRTKSAEAQKLSESSLLMREGYITTCDFEEPHSRLKAREIHVYLDDKVVLKDVVMMVGPVPLLYLPSYTHPLDDKRPRVTIIPGKSKDWGLFTLTSWRAYLHENLQGRIHVDYRERRDLASGVDMKYRLPAGGQGTVRTYYTNERDIQREHVWSKETTPTTERERYRMQLRHRWEMDQDTQATLELHRMRDPTFIKDFFPIEYEREQTPRSYFQIIRSSAWYGLTFLLTKRLNSFETVSQQFPQVTFDVRPLRIPWLPSFGKGFEGRISGKPSGIGSGWYYQSTSDYAHLNRVEPLLGTQNSVLRFDTLQQLFYSLRAFRFLNLRPFAGIRQTWFSRGAAQNSTFSRRAFSTGIDVSTKIFRMWEADTRWLGMEIKKLRHVITPTLAYQYQADPTVSANRFLQFDGIDSVAKSKTLSPSIEQKLQTKRLEGKRWQTVDLARFVTSVTYDLEGQGGRGGRIGTIGLDLETRPYRWLYAESDAAIDPHIGKFAAINADFLFSPGASSQWAGRKIGEHYDRNSDQFQEIPWAAGLGWRYQRNTSAQLVLETEFNLDKKWRVGVYQGLDVKRFINETRDNTSRTVKKIYSVPQAEYRLRRDLHEWTVELVYQTSRAGGNAVLLLFRLKEFPDLPLEFERSYHRPKGVRYFSN